MRLQQRLQSRERMIAAPLLLFAAFLLPASHSYAPRPRIHVYDLPPEYSSSAHQHTIWFGSGKLLDFLRQSPVRPASKYPSRIRAGDVKRIIGRVWNIREGI